MRGKKMPEIKSCPKCHGNAYSTPCMDGERWCAVPGRSEVKRLSDELQCKEVYVDVLEKRVFERDDRIAKQKALLEEAVAWLDSAPTELMNRIYEALK
jgi:hypothetical protein